MAQQKNTRSKTQKPSGNQTYCGWKKSCTTLMVKTLWIMGINTPINWCRISSIHRSLLEIPTLAALIFPAPTPPFSLGISQHKVAVALHWTTTVGLPQVGRGTASCRHHFWWSTSDLPSGKLTWLWKITLYIYINELEMAIFNSYVSHYQRVDIIFWWSTPHEASTSSR